MLVMLLSSCKTMYRANKLNIPVFKKKKELQTSLVTGSSGIELQGAYSINNNIAVMLNGVYDNSKVRVMDTIQGVKDGNSEYSNVYGEGAIGYYRSFGRDTSKMAAVFLGGGVGSTRGYSDHWGIDMIKYNSDYNKSIISKDVTGKALDYQLSLDVNFTINYNGEDQDFTLNQNRNIKNYSDSFEQKNYENTIKESFASVITEQLILKLTNIK